MEIKNEKTIGTYHSCTYTFQPSSNPLLRIPFMSTWFKKYASYQTCNLIYQLMDTATCIHVRVIKRNGVLYVANYGECCMLLDDCMHQIDKYFMYNTMGYVLMYIETDDDIREQVNDDIMKFSRVCLVYGVENTLSLSGKICVLQNTKVFKIQNQKEYDALSLDTDTINVVIQACPYKLAYVVLNIVSGCTAVVCWMLATVTAYLFWWLSFYSLIACGTVALYVHGYVGVDNKSMLIEGIIPRHQSVFLIPFYASHSSI